MERHSIIMEWRSIYPAQYHELHRLGPGLFEEFRMLIQAEAESQGVLDKEADVPLSARRGQRRSTWSWLWMHRKYAD